MTFGIFTQKQHATKIVNFMNITDADNEYIISTDQYGPETYDYDIGICYCFPHLINVDDAKHKHCTYYNYHPAPLSNKCLSYGDWGNYARGMYDLMTGTLSEWGVSLHVVTNKIDDGPILRVLKVPLRSVPIDISEIADISHYYLFQLFKNTILKLRSRPMTKQELDALC